MNKNLRYLREISNNLHHTTKVQSLHFWICRHEKVFKRVNFYIKVMICQKKERLAWSKKDFQMSKTVSNPSMMTFALTISVEWIMQD
jgi:hypothetical protein